MISLSSGKLIQLKLCTSLALFFGLHVAILSSFCCDGLWHKVMFLKGCAGPQVCFHCALWKGKRLGC